MNKLILSSVLFFFIASSLCGNTLLPAKETRSIDSFKHIAVSGNIELTLVKSNVNEATIDVSNGEVDDLITEIKGNTLRIKFKDNKWNWGKNNRKGYVTLKYNMIEGISSAAGCTVESDEIIEADDFDLDTSSGADVNLEIKVRNLNVDVSSGGSIELSGSAEYQDVDVSSGGGYDGYDLICKKTKVEASSGGGAEVFAAEEIIAKANSGGGVKYKGDPKKTDIDSSISGSIRKR